MLMRMMDEADGLVRSESVCMPDPVEPGYHSAPLGIVEKETVLLVRWKEWNCERDSIF